MAAKDMLWGTTPKSLGKPYKRHQEACAHQVAGAAHDAEGDDGHKGGVQAVRGGQAGHGRERHALGHRHDRHRQPRHRVRLRESVMFFSA